LEPVIFEKEEPGGLIRNANLVENYLGFPFGVSPDYLVESFEKHLMKFEIDIRREEVLKAGFKGDSFIVRTKPGTSRFDFLVIATGTRPRRQVQFEKKAPGKVFYEVWPLKKSKGKEIGIIGGGDAAFDYALNLSVNNQVKIFNRSNRTRCLPLLFERCEKNMKIRYFADTVIEDIQDNGRFMTTEFRNKNKKVAHSLDYLIFATGREPEKDFIDDNLVSNAGSLEQDGKLYFIGDVRNELFRQVSIATGDGIRAAMRINHIIRNT
jgi:thioredoxin reductase